MRSFSRFPSMALVALCLLVLAVSQSSAQSSQDVSPTDLVMKRTVRRVIVDVVVTDSIGRPVSGLTAKDFSVREDDQPQKILTFDVHSLENQPQAIPKVPALPVNTFLNLPSRLEQGPLYVLLYDMVNMEVEDQPRARQQILKFIREKPAGARFAIFVISDRLRLVQGFTDDENQLYATLDPSSPKPHIPRIFLYGRNHGLGDPFFMVSVFTNIAHYLEGLPGRKNLIWYSSRFPVRLFPQKDDPVEMREDLTESIAAMTRAQIAVYTVDAGGISAENPHGPEAMSDTGRIAISGGSGGAPPGGPSPGGPGDAGASGGGRATPPGASGGSGGSGGGVEAGAGASLIMTNQTAQRDIAAQTGGHAFLSTNDLTAAFADATEIGGNYYSVTYSPSNTDYNGALRRIHVVVAKPGYHLSYRRTYYAYDPALPAQHLKVSASSPTLEEVAVRKPGDSLFANMQHGAPLAHDLLFKAHLYTSGAPALGTPEQMANLAEQPAYFQTRHKDKPAKPVAPIQLQSYAIDYTIIVRQAKSSSQNIQPNLEVAAAAYDADGKMLNGVVDTDRDGWFISFRTEANCTSFASAAKSKRVLSRATAY